MSPRARHVVALCFFLSGAAGLLCEVAWSRSLHLVLGSSNHAITTVVATYMLGLGLGGALLGRFADRSPRPARLYAFLEIGIGAFAVLSPVLLAGLQGVYVALTHALEPGPALLGVIRPLLAGLVLLVPTLLMGGTLPLLARYFVAAGDDARHGVGALYGWNTLGAVAGTALGGFVTMERLGLGGSLALAGGIDIVAGATVLLLRLPPLAVAPAPVGRGALAEQLGSDRVRLAALLALGAGLASLAAQVAWTRLLSLLIGSSTHAFTLILLSFLLGIGLGGAWIGRRRRGGEADPLTDLTRAQLLAAGGGLVLLLGFPALTRLVLHVQQNPLLGFADLLWLRLGVVLLAVLPATIGMGLTFPLAVAVAVRQGDAVGRGVGIVYAANTLGCILGAVGAGFFLLPRIGVHATLRLAIAVHVLTAILALRRRHAALGFAAPAVAVALAAILTVARPWPAHLLGLGSYLYGRASLPSRIDVDRFLARGAAQILFSREGASTEVSVWEGDFTRGLRIGGKVDASTGWDMETQILSGVRAALAHPAPRESLVIGAGSGVTARGLAAQPGMRSVVLVEIEPAVVEAGSFFAAANGGVYRDPRLEVVVEDGRNYLLSTRRQFDVVVSEPSNPWMAGNSALFTREFYALVLARLRPAGVFCQWIQQYDTRPETLRRMMSTLLEAFPHTQVWSTGGADLLVLGSRERLVFSRDRTNAFLAANREWLRDLRLLFAEDAEDLFAKYVLDRPGMEAFVAGAEPYTDDPPELEFAALRTIGDRRWAERVKRDLLAARAGRRPALATLEGLPPGHADYNDGRLLLEWLGPSEALPYLRAAVQADPSSAKRWRWFGDVMARTGDRASALEAWRRGLVAAPSHPLCRLRLAEAALALGNVEEAATHLAAVAPEERDLPHAVLEATWLARVGRPEPALERLHFVLSRAAAVADPPRVVSQVIAIYDGLAAAGASAAVRAALDREVEAWPRVPALARSAAVLSQTAGDHARALVYFDRVLSAGPDLAAFAGRARAALALGRLDLARESLADGLAYAPWDLELRAVARGIDSR